MTIPGGAAGVRRALGSRVTQSGRSMRLCADRAPPEICWTTPRRLQYVTHPDRPLVDDGELVDPCLPEP